MKKKCKSVSYKSNKKIFSERTYAFIITLISIIRVSTLGHSFKSFLHFGSC